MSFRDWLFGSERVEREVVAEEDIELASTLSWEAQIAAFWANLQGVGFSPTMIDRVWVANRCQHMTAAAISSMPLRHYGARKPAWVANPDPVWFPNGIRDAIYALVDSMYRWGDAFLYVTSRYADGYPSAWTVLDSERMSVSSDRGQRIYRLSNTELNPANVVQISRNPRGLVGSSALAGASAYANSLLAAADMGRVMMGSGTPTAVIKSGKKLTQEQAQQVQTDWMNATAARRGAPAVLPPDMDFETLSFSPKDLLLLEVQQFDAQLISALYGIPAAMVNMPIEGGLNYQTPLLALEQWWRVELRPTAERIASSLASNMLAAGSWVEFDEHKFVAGTFDENAKTWVELVAAGIASAEEAHAALLGGSGKQSPEEAIDEFLTPPSAGASPAQQPAGVVALRPTTVAN